jgi:hypothetical protein
LQRSHAAMLGVLPTRLRIVKPSSAIACKSGTDPGLILEADYSARKAKLVQYRMALPIDSRPERTDN